MIFNFYSPRVHVQWNVQSIGYIISFRIYDIYFHHDVRGHGAGVTLPRSMRVDFFCDYFCFGLAYSLRQAGLLKKDKVKVDFRTLFFKFFRHSKASGVLPVCDSGLILWTYKVTVLAHTKKSTLIESVNKLGCEGRSKSHCQQLRDNTLRRSKGYTYRHNM